MMESVVKVKFGVSNHAFDMPTKDGWLSTDHRWFCIRPFNLQWMDYEVLSHQSDVTWCYDLLP